MAAPVVAARATARTTAVDVTSHAITLPAGVVAGDLLVVVFSVDGNPTCSTSSTGWYKVGQASNTTVVTGAIFQKYATGSDALTITTTASEQSSHVSLRITGGGVLVAASANGSSTNSNPPSLTDVSDDHLWIATRSGDSTVVASAYPTNYTTPNTAATGNSIAAVGTTSASTNVAERTVNASTTEDPGTFTSANEQWVSWTIGVAPKRTGTPLSQWDSAKAAAGSTRAKWLAIGDSLVEGRGASVRANRWVELAAATLRTRAGVTGGGRTYATNYNQQTGGTWGFDSVAYAGTATLSNGGWAGYRRVYLDPGASATWTVTGTSVDLWYASYPGAGAFSYAVDGGSATTINADTANPASYVRTTVSLGASGSHTVAIAGVSGAATIFMGLQVHDSTAGIALYDGGRSGLTTGQYITPTTSGGTYDWEFIPAAWAIIAPDLVTIELGLNDAFGSLTPASMVANLRTMIAALRGLSTVPSIVLVIPYAPDPSYITGGLTWADYAAALRMLVAGDGMLASVDLAAVMPTANTAGTGFYDVDGVHPNDSGHAQIASLTADAVSPASAATEVADTASGSDTVATASTAARTGSDTATAADTAALVQVIGRDAADAGGATDAVSSAQTFTSTVSDSATVVDAVSPAVAYGYGVADTAAVGDSATQAAGYAPTPADTATAADTAVGVLTGVRAAADTAAGSDTASFTTVTFAAAADTAAGSDTASFTTVTFAAAADTAAGSDTATMANTTARPVADSAAGSDVTGAEVGGSRGTSDSADGADGVAAVQAFGSTAADLAAGADSAGQVAALVRAPADIAAATDGVSATFLLSAGDTASAVDSTTQTGAYTPAVADIAAGADATSTAAATTAGDSSAATDTSTGTVTYTRSLADAVAAADGIAVDAAGQASSTISDTGSAVDEATPTTLTAREVADSATAVDTATTAGSFLAAVADQATATDSASATAANALTATAADTASATDQSTVALTGVRAAAGTASATDGTTVALTGVRAAADTAAGSDTVTADLLVDPPEESVHLLPSTAGATGQAGTARISVCLNADRALAWSVANGGAISAEDGEIGPTVTPIAENAAGTGSVGGAVNRIIVRPATASAAGTAYPAGFNALSGWSKLHAGVPVVRTPVRAGTPTVHRGGYATDPRGVRRTAQPRAGTPVLA